MLYLLTFVCFVGQSMSTLAQELKARGITLVDPLQAAVAKSNKAGVAFDDCGEDFDFEVAEREALFGTPQKKKVATPSKQVLPPSATRTPRKKSALKGGDQKGMIILFITFTL